MAIIVFLCDFNYYAGITFSKDQKMFVVDITLAHQLLINYLYKLLEVLNLEVIFTGQ